MAPVVLWNTADLGYLTVAAGAKLAAGEFSAGMAALEAGRLGSVQVQGSQIILGPPLMFTKGNIDQFDF